jgi:hypothetical protein
MRQSNLGLAWRWLGALSGDISAFDASRAAFSECEVFTFREAAPFKWAIGQWNIADLALARYGLAPDPALLAEARRHVAAAREVFVEGSEYQTTRCDQLSLQTDAAEAGG